MREIERAIRKKKREKTAYTAAGLDGQAKIANAKLRELNKKYRSFAKAAGLRTREDRVKVI